MSVCGRPELTALFVIALSAQAGCRGCKSDAQPSAEAGARGVHAMELEITPGKPLAPPSWSDRPDATGIGLPPGCELELPVRQAPLPADARFFGAHGVRDWLALARPGGERALIDLGRGRGRDLPWQELDAPPLIERAKSGWIAAFSSADSPRRAVLWREAGPVLELARGDQLDVADVRCHAERCAILTSLARASAAPGATLIVGDPSRADGFRSIDIEADPGAPWQPLAIVRFDGGPIEVALATENAVALWRASEAGSEKLGEVSTPFGAWDVVTTPRPLVVARGASADGGCRIDESPLKLVPFAGEAHEVTIGVSPEGVIARSLEKGALIAWIAPVSCQITTRTVVQLLWVDEHGAPRASPMAVADAAGFALATEGSKLSLWLRTREGISWVRARCGG